MSPDEMSEWLAEWAATRCGCREYLTECAHCHHGLRRVVCVEHEGPRRTWLLYEGGRQVGHVRMKQVNGWSGDWWWTWEASDRTRTREMLGLGR
jgi:hypothetical protein